MMLWNREQSGRCSSTSHLHLNRLRRFQRERRSRAACSTRTGMNARTLPVSKRLCSCWTTSSMCSLDRAGNFAASLSTTSPRARNSSLTPIGKVSGFRGRPSRLDAQGCGRQGQRQSYVQQPIAARRTTAGAARAPRPPSGAPRRCTRGSPAVVSAGAACGSGGAGSAPGGGNRQRPAGTQSVASPSGYRAVPAAALSFRGGRWLTGSSASR